MEGRGRAAGSRSVLLALEDWIAKKENLNLSRELLMKNAINAIKSTMTPSEFREQVRIIRGFLCKGYIETGFDLKCPRIWNL